MLGGCSRPGSRGWRHSHHVGGFTFNCNMRPRAIAGPRPTISPPPSNKPSSGTSSGPGRSISRRRPAPGLVASPHHWRIDRTCPLCMHRRAPKANELRAQSSGCPARRVLALGGCGGRADSSVVLLCEGARGGDGVVRNLTVAAWARPRRSMGGGGARRTRLQHVSPSP